MIGISLCVVGVIMLIMAASRAAKAKKFTTRSASIKGTVASKERIKKEKSDSYRLTVHYTVAGTEYRKRLVCTHGDYINTDEGDPFELLYLVDDPEQAARPRDIKPQTVRLFLILGVGFLLVGAAAYFFGL